METGFYPFVFDKLTMECMAHGENSHCVGQHLDEIFRNMGIGFSSTSELHNRFVQAAEKGGDWVHYMWKEDDMIRNKVAFVTNATDRYILFST